MTCRDWWLLARAQVQIPYRCCTGHRPELFVSGLINAAFGFKLTRLLTVTVLKDTLEKRGALAQIKARIRAEVFNALDDRSEPRPTLPRENLLINELIREYLEYNKYKYTASVLTAGIGDEFVSSL